MEATVVGLIVLCVLCASVVGALLRFQPQTLADLFARLRVFRLGISGIELQFATQEFESAVKERTPEGAEAPATGSTLSMAKQRIGRGTKILWVDDHHEGNEHERRALQFLGARVSLAKTNEDAAKALGQGAFDLVISDIGRSPPEAPTEGLSLPAALKGRGERLPPIVYYVGDAIRPTTEDGYPVVDQPVDLFDRIADSLGGD